MSVKIFIDSASDILPAEAAALDMIHVPMTVRFGMDEYLDGVELTHEGFYEKLIESDTIPTTSQIPPAVWQTYFERELDEGDTAVVITVSSRLSGTYQSACLAASSYGGRIRVVDSDTLCIAEGVLAKRACEIRDTGASADEIAAILDHEKKNLHVLAMLDTLEYLKRGGRISSAVAFAGGVLGIKPVITVKDGAVALLGKARGSRQGNNLLRELVSGVGGIDFSRPFALAYSGCDDKLLQKYISDSSELWEGKTSTLPIYTVGCCIGTHAGPGAVAIAFFADNVSENQ